MISKERIKELLKRIENDIKNIDNSNEFAESIKNIIQKQRILYTFISNNINICHYCEEKYFDIRNHITRCSEKDSFTSNEIEFINEI